MVPMLSHYTSERSLISIARSQSLWATDFLSLNDDSEFVYAFSAIHAVSLGLVMEKLPADLRDGSKDTALIQSLPDRVVAELKAQTRTGDGYGALYVCSFARGRNDDEETRGILTLWDRYTRNAGYCLQFEEVRVRHLLELESMRNSYAWIDLAEVRYGVDQQGSEFRYLVAQLTAQMMRSLYQETHDLRIGDQIGDIAPHSVFARRLLSFCGTHKDPAFSDEREMRILAYPVKATEGRPFTGLAVPKTIYRRNSKPDGARYIILGESVLPGFIPKRIVAGPNAQVMPQLLEALYPLPPRFEKSTIPIR